MNYYIELDSTTFYDNMSVSVSCTNSACNSVEPLLVDIRVIMVGDADKNGKVDIGDVIYISKFIANPNDFSNFDKRTADVNEDGVITEEDDNLVMSYLVGLVEHF